MMEVTKDMIDDWNAIDPKYSTHLGDGAYATLDGFGGAYITANHHRPALATDRVRLDVDGLKALHAWIAKQLAPQEQAP